MLPLCMHEPLNPAWQLPKLSASDRLPPNGSMQPVPMHRPPNMLLMLDVQIVVPNRLANRQSLFNMPTDPKLLSL